MNTVTIEKGNVPVGAALERRILDKVHWLERFYPALLTCRVAAEGPGAHHRHGAYRFRLSLHARGTDLVIHGKPASGLRTALTAAFDAARRCLEDRIRRHRGI